MTKNICVLQQCFLKVVTKQDVKETNKYRTFSEYLGFPFFFVIQGLLLQFNLCFLHIVKATRLHYMFCLFVSTFYTYKLGQPFHVVNWMRVKVFICQSDAWNVWVLF